MKRIVVGFDGSDESHDALRLGKMLAKADSAQLEVAVALQYAPLPIEVEAYDRTLAEHFDEVFAETERELGEGKFVRRELREGSAARALTELAETENPELIVIGSTHRGALGRVYPGSVGERLLNGAPSPVAVAPRGFARGERFGLGVFGVAYDGTAESKLALAAAEDLAKRHGASLRLIAAVPYMDPLPSRIGHTRVGFRKLLHTYFREVLDQGMSTLPYAAETETVLEDGDPAEVLARQGVELDLLVMGSRGYGPLRRALLGGVSAEVMRTAPCPVIVVPRSSTAAKDAAPRRVATTTEVTS
jgi:nucleotide-binding universal stress UspA family protein